MNDLIDCVGIGEIIRKSGYDPATNFEAIYSRLHRERQAAVLEKLDAAIRSYFSQIILPEVPTLYDYLILSLRPKDTIVTFNWDPLLPQAYKRWRHLGAVLPDIQFLHGNIDVGIDREKKKFGFMSDEPYPGRTLVPTRLLYPVEEKNYNSDDFIAEQWRKTTDYMAEAYYVTVYGYSAPTTDVEAKALLLKSWTDNPTRELAEIDIVDIRDPSEVRDSWSDFIVRTHGGASKDFSYNRLMRHPRRSCESFAFATLQIDPWRADPFPACRSLAELEMWIKPLIDEEASGRLSGEPLH
jgi:hypothetical protein